MGCMSYLSIVCSRGARELADRLGWKAMPFARDDLDSNFVTVSLPIPKRVQGCVLNSTLVSMFGEDCIVGYYNEAAASGIDVKSQFFQPRFGNRR